MKQLIPILLFLGLPLSGQLRITEVMSDSAHSSTGANGDWFEITNTGDTAVNVGGLSFDDEDPSAGASGPLPAYLLQPGASMIILDNRSAASFRTLWNIDPSVRIVSNLEISNFPGLSRNGDAVYLFSGTSSNSQVLDSFIFGPATTGASFARYNNGDPVPGNVSREGVLMAYRSNDEIPDVGSPGLSTDIPEPAPPFFLEPFETAAIAGIPIDDSEFRVQSLDPNPDDVLTLSLSGAPGWLGLSPTGNGVARFTGTPPAGQLGSVTFNVISTDNTDRSATQEYRIEILPASSPIILNEYNGVSPNQFLGGGGETDPNAPSDLFFGRIEGNGGPWVEFVVTEDLDLRGWTLEIRSDDQARLLKFSDHPALAYFPAGTILTLTEGNQLTPTRFNAISLFTLSGYSWTNIWMHDSQLINQEASVHPDSPAIGSDNSRFSWFDSNENLIYGPAGESIALRDTNGSGVGDELLGLSNTEVFKLETDPTSAVNPLNVNHDDGVTSTFGRPNQWNNNLSIQSFAPYLAPNDQPVFGPLSESKAARGAYDVSVIAVGGTVTVLDAPDFLDITPGFGSVSITNNRPLTVSDIGSYEVTLQTDNGADSHNLGYLVFDLKVLHPAPSVILNEYNAVANDRFLNGGTLNLDQDGLPNAEDSHFGRVLANGRNWFEIVVVGNDTPGSLDLRNWSIEVGEIAFSGKFETRSTINLNDTPTWSSVPHGSILTFIDRNTAGGGLNTELNRVNRLTTDGYVWSNIFLGTPALVTVENPLDYRINSSNTAFIIRDGSGTVVFGPAGEGIAPVSGIGNTDIFELNNDPSSQVAPIDNTTDTMLGYDDGSSGSTFGSPNLFAPLNSSTDRPQDFTSFIPESSAFNDFLAEFGLAGASPDADSDIDGFTNFDEYIFGGNPADNTSYPASSLDPETGTLTMDIRTSDPLYPVAGQKSPNLEDWDSTDLEISDDVSSLGPDFVLRSVTYNGSAPRMFLRFATTN